MAPRVKLVASMVLFSAALIAPAAHAGGADAAAAEALFQQGRAAAEKGDWETACTKLRESQRLDPAVGTAFNVGNCEEKLGHLTAAWTLFVEVANKTKPGDERHGIAKKRADALEKRIPKLTIRLGPGAPAGTKVRRDDTALAAGSLGAALPADPGKHTITITAPGRKTVTRDIDLAEGERRDIEVLPGAEGEGSERVAPTEEAAPTAEPSASPGSTQRTAGWVLGGVGVAGVLVGVITGGLTVAKKSAADAHCPNKACDAEGLDAVNAGRTLAKVSPATLIIGLAAVGGGVALILTSGSGDEKKDQKKGETALVPSFGPTGGGLTLVRSF
jgi:hypothetical protein